MNAFAPSPRDESGAPNLSPALAPPLAQALQQLAALSSDIAQTPMALISLITPHQQAVVGQRGFPQISTGLPHLAWTIETLQQTQWLVVPDTGASAPWRHDWLVRGPARIRFYAGKALRCANGDVIGTLCVMDTHARNLSPSILEQLDALTDAMSILLSGHDGHLAQPSANTPMPEMQAYQAIVESQTDLMALATPDGRLTFVNQAYAHHVGRPASSLIGANLYDHLPAANRPAAASQFTAVCQHGLVLGNEVQYPLPDGQQQWLNWTYHPICDAQGRVQTVHVVGRDITERKLTERSLKDSQTRLRSLYESTPAMMHSIDARGHLLTVSDTWLAKMGYVRGEVIGRHWTEFLTPAALEYERKIVEPLYPKDGRRDHIEYQMVRKDGQLIDVLLSSTMERDEQGLPARTLAILEDVTEKHEVQAALRANQERLTLATQANGIGIWELDLVKHRLTWSEMMFQIFGITKEAFEGRPEDWYQTVHPDDIDMCLNEIEQALSTGQPMSFDFRILHQDGRLRYINTRATVFFDEDGHPQRVLGTNYDVTDRKQMERELAEKHELLRVTLHSIGDGVITTDANGLVQWLNPVAERMTGWSSEDAFGLPLPDIFQVIDEETGEPELCPVLRCLSTERLQPPCVQPQLIARDGQIFGIEHSAAPIRDAQGQVLGVILVFHDVTEQRKMSHEMSFRATHDQLTGLANRVEFESRLQRTLADTHSRDSEHALMYIDLDQFKLVNDACGHAVGDLLLKQVTDLLHHCLRARDTLARLGGDEFGAILEHCSVEQAHGIAQKICDQMEEFRFVHEGRRFRVGTSIGLVPLDKRWESRDAAMQAADTSCYAAKEAGRNRVHVWFDTDQNMRIRKGEMQWATRLEQALDENRFLLYGQRIDAIRPQSEGMRCEVLLRLQDHDGAIIPPGAFLPAAERFHLAQRIDRWVVRHVLELLSSQHPALADLHTLAVNLSGQSISDPTFQSYLFELIEKQKFDLRKLCFEITETAAITNLNEVGHFVKQMRRMGMRLALDDFGSGSSSFGYLKALQVDYLKIDGQFIKDVVHDPLDRAAVRCFCDVAQVLGLKTVGEFVEDGPILRELQTLGVDYAQGYLIHKPEPLSQLLGIQRPTA